MSKRWRSFDRNNSSIHVAMLCEISGNRFGCCVSSFPWASPQAICSRKRKLILRYT